VVVNDLCSNNRGVTGSKEGGGSCRVGRLGPVLSDPLAPPHLIRTRWLPIAAVIGLALPGMWLRLSPGFGPLADTTLYGLTIVSAAFLLSWCSEAAQVDVSQGLALALIALVAILPEYAVDVTFAWKAGQDPRYAPYAVANMTGANRVLIGLGWPLVFGVFWFRTWRRALVLERGHSIEILTLIIATAYAFLFLLRRKIELIDTVLLLALFLVYVALIAKAPTEPPHLIGPARSLGTLPRGRRYAAMGFLFGFAALAILATAEPFAEGLIETGKALGIDEFLLVQIAAPIASEAPEFLIASLLALHGRPSAGLGALVSSKVNQWTLLVGALPVAYALSSGSLGGLPLDNRQVEEMFLTAAQSTFAVVLIARLDLTWWGAALLGVLFVIQFVIPAESIRVVIAWIYLGLALLVLVVRRTSLRLLVRTGRECAAYYIDGRSG
jgi:cation:H+ antiporter